VQDLVAGAMVC